MRDQVDFQHVDKHRSFLYVDPTAFWLVWPGIPKVPKISLQANFKKAVSFLPALAGNSSCLGLRVTSFSLWWRLLAIIMQVSYLYIKVASPEESNNRFFNVLLLNVKFSFFKNTVDHRVFDLRKSPGYQWTSPCQE